MSECNCVPAGNPSVVGACGCPVHGMKALRAVLGSALGYISYDSASGNEQARRICDEGFRALTLSESDTDRPLAPSEPKPCTSGPDASFSGYAHRTETEFDGRMGSQ